MRYSMSERHSYGNGFRAARKIGLRKLRHQMHGQNTYYQHGNVPYKSYHFSRHKFGAAGNWTHSKQG